MFSLFSCIFYHFYHFRGNWYFPFNLKQFMTNMCTLEWKNISKQLEVKSPLIISNKLTKLNVLQNSLIYTLIGSLEAILNYQSQLFLISLVHILNDYFFSYPCGRKIRTNIWLTNLKLKVIIKQKGWHWCDFCPTLRKIFMMIFDIYIVLQNKNWMTG